MASRRLEDLNSQCRELVDDFLDRCQGHVRPLVYCTYRSPEEQAYLWRAGRRADTILLHCTLLRRRGKPHVAALIEEASPHLGKKVLTHAGPYESAHNYGLAIDCAPLLAGKLIFDEKHPLFVEMVCHAEGAGLEWAGRWSKFVEYVHFQMPGWKEYVP